MDLIVIVLLASLLIGLSKGGLGAPLVVIVTPLLSLAMPIPQAVSTVLPLLMIADVFALWMYWKTWDMYYVRVMMPMAIIGIVIGTALLLILPDLALRRILGIFTLIFIAYRLLDYRLKALDYHPENWHGYLAGAATGLGSALANTGAPPFTAYMLLQAISPTAFVGTTTLFFAVVNLLKLIALVLMTSALHRSTELFNPQDLVSVVWAIPLLPAGVWLGRWLVVRLNRQAFEYSMLLVLFLASMILLFVAPR